MEVTPPANAWEKIKASLEEKEEKNVAPVRRIPAFLRYAAAAAIIAAIAARDVDTCDQLAKEHADKIVKQIQHMMSRDLRRRVTI